MAPSTEDSVDVLGFRRRFRAEPLSTTSPTSFKVRLPIEVRNDANTFDLVHLRSIFLKVNDAVPHFRTIVPREAFQTILHTRTILVTGFDILHARSIYQPGAVVLFDEDIHRPTGRAELVT